MRHLTYLACPYTFKATRKITNPVLARKVEDVRAHEATKAAAWLIRVFGFNVFSPITHSHWLNRIGNLGGDWDFWKQIDTEYLEMSKRLIVLCITGWERSTGVQAEIKIAKEMGCEVQYLIKNKEHHGYILQSTPPGS